MGTEVLDVTAFVDRLVALRDLTAPTSVPRNIGRIVAMCAEVAERLAAAPHTPMPRETDPIDWIASEVDDAIMVIGTGLFMVSATDGSSTTIVSEGATWTVGPDERGTLVSCADADTFDNWIVTVDGAVARAEDAIARRVEQTKAEPVWQPTHRVGREALPIGGVPTGTYAPGAVLDPRLPVRVLETTADGWALVECSNTWQCYVAARGLVLIGGDDA
jgi:hypothetical protein